MSKKWQPKEIETLISLNSQKLSRKEISEQLGRSESAINMKMRNLKIYSSTTNYLTTQDKDRIITMFNEQISIKNIALNLNRNHSFISRIARDLGLISNKSKQITEQRQLAKENKRKCYLCQNIYDYSQEFFSGTHRICKKCNALKSNNRYKELRTNISLEQLLKLRMYQAKYRAKKNNYEFNITIEHLLALYKKQTGLCYYSGIPMEISIKENKINNYTLSIDKIIWDEGYTIENTVLCCDSVNTMKMQLNTKDFLGICNKIVNFSKNKL